MKIALGGRFHTKYPIAELGNIQVDGQDPLFYSTRFRSRQSARLPAPYAASCGHPIKTGFSPSAATALTRRESGYHAAHCAPALSQSPTRRTPVFRELLIFGGNHRQPHPWGDLIHGNPVGMRQIMEIAGQPGAHLPLKHHRRKRHRQHAKQRDPPPQKNGGDQQQTQCQTF